MNIELCKHCYHYMETADQVVCLKHHSELENIQSCVSNQIIQNLMMEVE